MRLTTKKKQKKTRNDKRKIKSPSFQMWSLSLELAAETETGATCCQVQLLLSAANIAKLQTLHCHGSFCLFRVYSIAERRLRFSEHRSTRRRSVVHRKSARAHLVKHEVKVSRGGNHAGLYIYSTTLMRWQLDLPGDHCSSVPCQNLPVSFDRSTSKA